ncbi:esterase-like activity of phytase-domain-containing protein [Phaeosphaeriaceae sp. PMI808]|nr:esterase-like activity of phytase-domain-containing protein [Phaeosphaeriaceae sp. PMI808]
MAETEMQSLVGPEILNFESKKSNEIEYYKYRKRSITILAFYIAQLLSSHSVYGVNLQDVSVYEVPRCTMWREAELRPAPSVAARVDQASVSVATCNGKKYIYEELAGYGKLSASFRDKHGDTLGGIGSAIALDKKSVSWKKNKGKNGTYEGVIYGLPDRGWNTQGTQNTQTRIHKFSFTFELVDATVEKPASPNFKLQYLDTVLLTGPDGTPLTGLDPTTTVTYQGFPTLPLAKYTGDGFGQEGPGGARVPLDTEGLVLGDDTAYVYQFDKKGKMIKAIRTPDAFIPIRNGTESFSAASPPIYDPKFKISPEQPTSGRGNNQGLEALTRSPDGKYLYTLLQSATLQDGGSSNTKRRNTRFLTYRIQDNKVSLEAEYAVQLPVLSTGRVASQSEMHYISKDQFLVLARDSGAGHGQDKSESIYRNADVIDISKATNILGKYDGFNGSIASRDGMLKSEIKPAEYCPWLSYNVNTQLNRFGVRNGGAQDENLLNEKWESFALIEAEDGDGGQKDKKKEEQEEEEEEEEEEGKEYYLISFSDNDFVTQNGFINFGKLPYKDASGFDLDNQVLVFKIRLPKGSDPI